MEGRLPDDLWLQIFKLGIESRVLDHTDICSVSMTCRHFDEITREPQLWAALLAHNFISTAALLQPDQRASKALFRDELEKKRKSERETREMFDEVMEFVKWLDNNFLDDEEANSDDGSSTRHAGFDNIVSSGHRAHDMSDQANTSDPNRSSRACARSFWSTVSTILLPKRSYI